MKAPTDARVHILHAHTTMSVLDGASPIKDYVAYAAEHELGACATTEHGYLLGDFDLFQATSNPELKSPVKPISGCEFYLMPHPEHVGFQKEEKWWPYFHLTVWAMNQKGHQNLISLSSRSWNPGQTVTIWGHHRPRVTWDDLSMYSEGLIVGSGCIEGPIGKCLLHGHDTEAYRNAMRLWDIFKGRMFFELMPSSVDNNYIKDTLIRVNDSFGGYMTFHPEDIMVTERGRMTAKEAMEAKVGQVFTFSPPRLQHHSDIDTTIEADMEVISATWKKVEKTFLGNQCKYPAPDGGRHHGCMQLFINDKIAKIAKLLKAPKLLTLDSHFVRPESKMIQDILLQNGNKDGWRFSTVYSQMNTQQAYESWHRNHHRLPDSDALFIEGVENNQALVDMVEHVKLPKDLHLPEIEYPKDLHGETENERLEKLVFRYIAEYGRIPKDDRMPEYIERLKREIKVIAHNPTINFLPYFITVHDICRYAREQGILVGPGRGSAAGCLLSYLMKITHVDPIAWDLSFERFLSLGRIARGKFPDIDLDFGDAKLIAEWMTQKHGDRFARICTTGTMKPKGAIRDVSRVLLDTPGNPEMAKRVNEACEQLPKTFPPNTDARKWLYGYEKDGVAIPGVIEDAPGVQSLFAEFPDVKICVDQVLDIPRSLGKHASAYCLSDVPIGDLIPMCIISEENCTQLTMGPVEKLGLIKFDLLSINTLKDITGALKLIKQREGIDLDPWDLPFEQRVIEAFCEGRTETVFQFNSAISTNLCRQVKPQNVLDLANITANGRPGTMYALMEDGKTTLITAWVERRQGKREVEYLHPSLEPILNSSEGIFTYQEQLMKATVVCCGYNDEQADYVREIVGKKKPEDLEKILPELRKALQDREWTESQADSFISTYKAASGYSFNKSHSVCYALIGYACAYLKTMHPLEWWTSVLSNSTTDDLKEAARYTRDVVVPPDVNTSQVDFYIIDDKSHKIVFPLGKVKNVKKAGEHIVSLQPFKSFEDFYEKVTRKLVNAKVVASLIWAGAFDKLEKMEGLKGRNDLYIRYLKMKKDKKKLLEFVPLPEEEILSRQTEILAIGNADFVSLIKRKTGLQVVTPEEALTYPTKMVCRVAGVVSRATHIKTKKSPPRSMGFIDLTNESGMISVTVFPDDYFTFKDLMKEGQILVIQGEINEYNGKKNMIALDMFPFKSYDGDEEDEPAAVVDFPAEF